MVTIEEIFEKKFEDITEEDINWYFDNCVGYPEVEEDWAKALPELPEGWEKLLWQRYTPDEVVRKYKDDYLHCMMFYNEAKKYPELTYIYENFLGCRAAFLPSWKSKMVLKWVEEGRFSKEEGHELKKMYFDLAMF